jgi:hypothetical protein
MIKDMVIDSLAMDITTIDIPKGCRRFMGSKIKK